MSNLLIRTLSGAAYVAVVMLASFSGATGQIMLAGILGILAVLEWMQFGNYRIHWLTSILIIFSIFLSIYSFSGIFDVGFIQIQICRGLLALSIAGVFLSQAFNRETMPQRLFQSGFALIYIGVPMVLIPMIADYQGENHPWMLASVFILIWCNDTFAYLVGTRFGRHKLFPRISPNKTWEGFLGGVIGTLLASVSFHYFLDTMPVIGWLGLAVVVLGFGTLGDLFESSIKRSFGMKDSGKFMPGHGGILDRIDSLLFAIPMAYFYLKIFENLH